MANDLPLRLSWDLAQDRWKSALQPLLALPQSSGVILKNVQLTMGSNVINHKLGRKLQGWYPVRVRSSATFYDTQDSNHYPELTLTLVSSANCVVDLAVF